MNSTLKQVRLVVKAPVNFIRSFRGERKDQCKKIALVFDFDSKDLHKNGQVDSNQTPSLAQMYQEFGTYVEKQLKKKYDVDVIKDTRGSTLEDTIER